jgi:uncharacterized protein (DUF2252 family)
MPVSSPLLIDETSTLIRRHVGWGDSAPDVSSSRTSVNENPRDMAPWKRPVFGSLLVGGMLLFAALTASQHPFPYFSTLTTQNKDMLIGWNTLVPAKPSTSSDTGETDASSRTSDGNLVNNQTFSYGNSTDIPIVRSRCEWVMKQFHNRDIDYTPAQLEFRYKTQSTDANVFYRATAHIFWNDFVIGRWGDRLTKTLKESATLQDGVPLDRMSTYTWVTGDQHLSNFGAFVNRHGDVVFSINDFDEGAIYDFQVDVLRIAVSVYNHALTNGLSDRDVEMVLHEFTDSYVSTVLRYIGNEDALLFELTAKTTTGFLRDFLTKVQSTNSYEKQMKKYTKVDEHGHRSFYKGPIGTADPDTKLATLPPEREEQIRSVFTATKYGATMMKLGWLVREWDDDFFTVLDVASRVGSGVGSSGVDRFYVLLKGTDGSFDVNAGKKNSHSGTTVVLDVKYEPPGAVTPVLTPDEAAWYQVLFPNDAARAVEAQRRLTSFTDPYTGWVILPDDNGDLKSFSIRQRSPWKDSPDLDELTDPKKFSMFMSQIAVSTATSHVRGSVGKKPGDFKSVVQALLGKHSNRRTWSKAVTELAKAYSKQVVLDYDCFARYVQEMYPP